MNTVILTGGGTAGHVAPNIALLPYLKNYRVHYCGEAGGMEEKMLAAYPEVIFHPLPCVKFRRSLSPKNLKIPFVLSKGVSQAKKLLRELKPTVVFSKGGYAALPVALAASSLKVPLVVHESDFSLGLTNRMVAKKCRYLCTAFPSAAQDRPNAIVTGSPVRRELYLGSAARIAAQTGLHGKNKLKLLVFGGSQGALTLNEALESALPELTRRFEILHIAGKHPFEGNFEGYARMEFCDRMADCYAWADCVVSRAGAGTLTELIALRKPALVIPLPKSRSSRGDQEQNAEYYRSQGLVRVLEQRDLSPARLVREIDELAANRSELISAMTHAPNPDGTKKIADLLLSL